MTRVGVLCLASSGVGIAALAWGHWENGSVTLALAVLLFGALWLAAQCRTYLAAKCRTYRAAKWRWSQPVLRRLLGTGMGLRVWFSTLGLVITAAAAAAGFLLGAPSGWMIVGALGGLLAWDLTDLDRRLGFAGSADDLSTIKRRHLAWLGLAAATGLMLATAAVLIPLHFSFALTVLLALAAVLGLARLVSWLYQA